MLKFKHLSNDELSNVVGGDMSESGEGAYQLGCWLAHITLHIKQCH